MATQGSTYGQATPEGVMRHRKHIKEQADAAKAQRRKKGRGNGKRYCYNGIKGKWPSAQKPLEVLANMAGNAV